VFVVLALAAFVALCALPRGAYAHEPTFAVYSKYEATIRGREIAFVFAFDKSAILSFLESEVAHRKVDTDALAAYKSAFSSYFFERFSVSNDEEPCTHAGELSRFFWDEPTFHIVAVTKFVCPAELHDITVRSRVTHDLPVAHQLVGDLLYRRVLARTMFTSELAEQHVSLPALPESGEIWIPPPVRHRGRISYVPVPDMQRRYEPLAAAELGADPGPSTPIDPHAGVTFWRFIGQGMLHIFTGYDHVLFILTLVVVVASWRQLAAIVTSFTAAHSLTLVLATLGVVNPSGRIVEPLIALTVLIVAVDALVRPNTKPRTVLAFAFGLIHGLGLSSALRTLGLSGRGLVSALVGFNVGVELGQLVIVAPAFALVLVLRKNEPSFTRIRVLLCASVAAIAVFWIAARVHEAFAG
jgi:hypothetical protein